MTWYYTASVYHCNILLLSLGVLGQWLMFYNYFYKFFLSLSYGIFQEFIQTLDEPMVRNLCVRSLRRGKGSMDHIHSLLIMEDDLDEDTESTPDMASASPITAQTSAEGPGPSSGTSLPWCKCGTCQVMPQELKINVVGKGDVSQIIQDFKNCAWTRMYFSWQ